MHRRGQIPTNANSGIASLKMDSAAIIFSESFEILPVLPVFLLCNYRLEEYNSTLWCVSHIFLSYSREIKIKRFQNTSEIIH